jgi:hypothetical protein
MVHVENSCREIEDSPYLRLVDWFGDVFCGSDSVMEI